MTWSELKKCSGRGRAGGPKPRGSVGGNKGGGTSLPPTMVGVVGEGRIGEWGREGGGSG